MTKICKLLLRLHLTFSQLLESHEVGNILAGSGFKVLQGCSRDLTSTCYEQQDTCFKSRDTHLFLKSMDKVAHNGDKDPISPVVLGLGHHMIVKLVWQRLGSHHFR